jgi:plasmid stabilization system protein ParE
MRYRAEFTARAARDLEALYLEKNAAGSQAAARWFNGLEQAVGALSSYPQRQTVRVLTIRRGARRRFKTAGLE